MGRYGNVLLVNGVTNWQTKVPAGTIQRLYIANASDARPYRFALDGVPMKVVGSDNGRVGNERFVDALTISPGERYIVDVKFTKTGTVAIKNNAPGAFATLGAILVTDSPTTTPAATDYATLRTNQEVINEIKDLVGQVKSSKRIALTMTMNMGSSHGMGNMGGMSGMGSSGTGAHMMSDGNHRDRMVRHGHG
jgi:FtsP/CotA-like multicopper oxidase with cupredoxin domain